MIRALFSGNALRIAAMLVFGLTTLSASAQVKPFFVVGSGPAPNGVSIFGADSPHGSTGIATPVGLYSSDQGNFNSLSFDPVSLSGTFEGSFPFTALNGDVLFCTYGDVDNGADQTGEYQVIDVGGGNVIVVFLAEFNPVPAKCTGQFKKVTDGSLIMLAATEPFPLVLNEAGFTPPFNYSWVGKGWLKFKQGKK